MGVKYAKIQCILYVISLSKILETTPGFPRIDFNRDNMCGIDYIGTNKRVTSGTEGKLGILL